MAIVEVRPHERRALAHAFAFFYFVLASYFVLRPIRDGIAVAMGVTRIPWLYAGTLAAMLVANPIFSALVVRLPARRFVPITYHFVAANLVAFYVAMRATGGVGAIGSPRVAVGFFVWTSAMNLFITSVFWAFMADVFRSEQAKRLFGFIGVGGTLGSISGSAITATLAERLGTVNLLLVSAVLLELAMVVVARFPMPAPSAAVDERMLNPAAAASGGDDRRAIGGSAWAGITHVARSPYLLGIALFLLLYVVGSTFLYAQQTDIVGRAYTTPASRTAVLARIELAVQTLTVVTQFFLTGRIIRWLGLAAALALLPALSVVGFAALGSLPVLATLATVIVLRRGMNFAITNPAMEVLFTVVSREDKYKAKSFIETFVYRAGDQLAAWTYAGLVALGLGITGTAFVAVPISAVWLALGLWLGRRQTQLARSELLPSLATGPASVAPVAAS